MSVHGGHGHYTHIDAFKEEFAWATDKWPCVICYLKTKKLNNKAILSIKQYRMHCYVVLSN